MQINSKAKSCSIWILFFVAAMTLVGCSDPAVDSQKMLQTAKDYIAKNSPREAALELKNALQNNPDNAEARYLLGLLNLDFGDTAGAEKEFDRAMRAGWNEEEAQLGLARAALNGNDFKKMVEGIEVKPEYSATTRANLHGLKTSALTGLGLRDQANKALAEGVALDANAFHVRKASIQLKLLDEDYKTARNQVVEALGVYPDNRELLLLSGITAMKGGDIRVGITANQRVIELEPSNTATIYGRQARLRLASLQIIDKQFKQAQSTLDPLLKLFPQDPQTNYLGGMLAFAEGNYALSEERLLKVLQVVPNHLKTMLLYGTVSFQQKNFEQAVNYLSKYVNATPDNIGARKLLGRAHMMLGQSNKAQMVLKPALATDADDVELLALVGLNDMRGGDFVSGIEKLQKAAETAPGNMALRKELALAYIKSGEAEMAIKELHAILSETDEKGNTETLLIVAHLKAGQPDKAIDTALGILAKKPDNPAAITLVGNVFSATGDEKEARNYFEKALKLSPGNPQTTLSMAQLEESEGNISAAVDMYEAMVDAGTKSIVPMLALARLAEKRGDREKLFAWLEKARAEAPQQVQPRIVLAEAYLRERNLQKAEVVVKESRDIAPDNSIVLGQWGRVLMASKRYNEALHTLTSLVEAEPDSVFARLLLAETYLNLKQTDDATKELKVVLEKDPKSIGALTMLARIELSHRRFDEADEYAKQIQAINPDIYIGHELSGDSWLGRRENAKANAAYEKAWEKKQSSNLAVKLSTIAVQSGKPAEGIDVLKIWLKDHDDDVRTLQVLGTLLLTTGQKDEAVQIYEKTLGFQPDNLVALNNLAGIYSKTKDPKALGLAEKAYRVAPDNAGVKDTYGWILVQEGELSKGRSLLKQAFEKLSGLAEVRYHYAVALIKSGDKSEGTEMLKTLLSEETQFDGREEAEKLLHK